MHYIILKKGQKTYLRNTRSDINRSDMRCKCCDTENNLQIFDIDRLGPPKSGRYEAMLICNMCNSSMSVKFENIRYEKEIIKILKELTRPRKGQWFVQSVEAYNWVDGIGYDFSEKKKVRPIDF